MHRALTALGVLGALLWASPSWASCAADTWCSAPDRSASGRELTNLTPERSVAFYDFSGTTDPPVIEINPGCEHPVIWLDPDEDGANTGAEIQLYRCNDKGTFSTTICPAKVLADTDGDGIINDVTIDGSTLMRIGQDGARVAWLGIDITANAGSDDARIMLECH